MVISMSFELFRGIFYYPTSFALIIGIPLILTGLMIYAVFEHVYWFARTKGTMIVSSSHQRPQDSRVAS